MADLLKWAAPLEWTPEDPRDWHCAVAPLAAGERTTVAWVWRVPGFGWRWLCRGGTEAPARADTCNEAKAAAEAQWRRDAIEIARRYVRLDDLVAGHD